MKNVRTRGFTVIELMIGLVIVAVLVSLAVPSFRDTLRKSRRSDAMNSIMDIHLSQERYRVNNPTYGNLSQAKNIVPAVSSLASPDGHYSLTVTGNTATNYTIVAATVVGDDQANDSCGDFTLAFTAGVITKTADGNDDLCWKK